MIIASQWRQLLRDKGGQGWTTSQTSKAGPLQHPRQVSFSQELFEKDLTEPTDEEDQAYKPANPISEAHCGHRTEDATALGHNFFSGNATELGGWSWIKPKKPV